MYIPGHFQLPDDYIEDFLSTPRAGNLVTVQTDGPAATFAPFYYDADQRILTTHIVRNNSQARGENLGTGLIIFDQDDAYVSPRDYATNRDLPNVPTWDYITIHARGPVTIDHDPQAALAVAARLTELMGDAESLERVGDAKLTRMSRAIVAVHMRVEHLEGKAKMSQNRHPEDVISLMEQMERQGKTELADYLRNVSLPYARARFDQISSLRDRHERQHLSSSGCPVAH